MQSVHDAVAQELDSLSVVEISPGMAAAALSLAAQMDSSKSATASANAASQLRMIMNDLRELAPMDQQDDKVTKLLAFRNERHGG